MFGRQSRNGWPLTRIKSAMPNLLMLRAAILSTVALGVCACTPSTPDQPEPKNEETASTSTIVPPTPKVPMAKAFAVDDSTDVLEFKYSYPAAAASVPDIVASLTDDMKTNKAAALKAAKSDQASAKESGFPFHTHSYQTQWTAKAATPRLLGLLAESYFYTGGAHGMTGYKTLLWDKIAKREVSIDDMIISRNAFATVITSEFCKRLNDARAEKRGAPVASADSEFDRCVDPLKQTIVPISKDGKTVDQLLIVIGPYEAGPYAEGSYEIALPVDRALLSTIKPEWRDAFTKG